MGGGDGWRREIVVDCYKTWLERVRVELLRQWGTRHKLWILLLTWNLLGPVGDDGGGRGGAGGGKVVGKEERASGQEDVGFLVYLPHKRQSFRDRVVQGAFCYY